MNRIPADYRSTVTSYYRSRDWLLLVTGSRDGTVRVWDAESGAELRRLEGHTDVVSSVQLSLDGRRVLSVSDDKTVRLWDATSGTEVRRFVGHTDKVNGTDFSEDGRLLITASDDRTARVWDVESGAELRRLDGHTDVVRHAFFYDEQRAMTVMPMQNGRFWDLTAPAKAVAAAMLDTAAGNALPRPLIALIAAYTEFTPAPLPAF